MGLLLAWLNLWARLLKRREWNLIRYYLLGQRQRGEVLYLRPAFDGGKDKDWLMSRVVPITTSQQAISSSPKKISRQLTKKVKGGIGFSDSIWIRSRQGWDIY
jgi:hypothetical protein